MTKHSLKGLFGFYNFCCDLSIILLCSWYMGWPPNPWLRCNSWGNNTLSCSLTCSVQFSSPVHFTSASAQQVGGRGWWERIWLVQQIWRYICLMYTVCRIHRIVSSTVQYIVFYFILLFKFFSCQDRKSTVGPLRSASARSVSSFLTQP